MKWNWKQHVIAFLILAAIPVSLAVTFPDLPDRIPIHFGLDGTPDEFLGRSDYAIFIVVEIAVVCILLTFIPFIDPFWKRIQPKYGLLLFIRDLALVFLLFVHLLSLHGALTGSFNVRLLGIGLGLLFIVLGNYLPRIPRNWFFGIRVPWTLASDEVWKRTHRLGGWLFVLGGFVAAVLSAAGLSMGIALAIPLVPVFVTVCLVYPYLLSRKIQKTKSQP